MWPVLHYQHSRYLEGERDLNVYTKNHTVPLKAKTMACIFFSKGANALDAKAWINHVNRHGLIKQCVYACMFCYWYINPVEITGQEDALASTKQCPCHTHIHTHAHARTYARTQCQALSCLCPFVYKSAVKCYTLWLTNTIWAATAGTLWNDIAVQGRQSKKKVHILHCLLTLQYYAVLHADLTSPSNHLGQHGPKVPSYLKTMLVYSEE